MSHVRHELKETDNLSGLLLLAGTLFINKALRKINFISSKDLIYTLEYTDAKTDKLRYLHQEKSIKKVMLYYDLIDKDEAIRDLYKDIRSIIGRMDASAPEVFSQIRIEFYLPGTQDPIVYTTRPGGYIYTRV
ncbi:MAG TPA: hypothetical protein VN843_07260 [Anaerolineales bacterium]|nr:hypothetical protein [Anaerolineales bacterium]